MARRWLLVLLVIAFVAVVVICFIEIEHLVATLRQGLWPWVLAAVLVVGLVHLFLRHHLEPYEITGAVMLLLGTVGLAGVPVLQATIVALAFRGLTFWLPMVFGFFMVRRLRLFS